MKKAFDQTVRDIKRGVNKKVLKVPSIEQKILDATSNEPWGPHGSLLADIAQATRNFHECQIIMSIIWKRANDTGKNWRHVYKALTVLEYLVAHGAERVIDDTREHAYQISALSNFQYIDSSGKDQGNNVRKKSQSIVVLVNDKEKIQEVRQKAAATRDKYRSNTMGGMYRPGSEGYGDRYADDRYEGRYANRDDERNEYGRDRDWGSRDDERYGRYGDSYGREGERYGKSYEERSRDYDYQGKSQNVDQGGNRANGDEDQYSSRGSGVKADDRAQDGSAAGRKIEDTHSGEDLGAPPSYEETVGAAPGPTYSDKHEESSIPNEPKESLASSASPVHTTSTYTVAPPSATPLPMHAPGPAPASSQTAVQHSYVEGDGFDEFDPRGPASVAPVTTTINTSPTSGSEMDLLGSLSEVFSSNALALMPASEPAVIPEANGLPSVKSGAAFAAATPASTDYNQSFDNPFEDGPFKAFPSTDSVSSQPQITTPTDSFHANSSHTVVPQSTLPNATAELSGPFNDVHPPSSSQLPKQESTLNQEIDILADILPPSAPSSFVNTQTGFPVSTNQFVSNNGFLQSSQPAPPTLTGQDATQNSYPPQTLSPDGFPTQLGLPSETNYPLQSTVSVSHEGFSSQAIHQAPRLGFHSQTGPSMQPNMPNPNFYGSSNFQSLSTGPPAGYAIPTSSSGPVTRHNVLSHPSSSIPIASQMGLQGSHIQYSSNVAPVLTAPSSTSPAIVSQSSKDKFETKSSVWADTLSRGLVNLNISGSKANNPLADIGVDFDAINRKEKRMEKTTAATVTSTVTMGKAMGSGSGMGRTGAGSLRSPHNPLMGSGMNIGIVGGPGVGMGGYGYGYGVGMNRPTGQGIGMGMSMSMGMTPGMNVQQPMGFRPGSSIAGGYNHIPGTGYGQYPHAGGYR